MFLNSKASQKAKGILTKNRSESIAFTPKVVFMIAQDNDPRFCTKREKIFVLFDSQNAHSRNGFRCTFFAKGAILSKSDFTISIETVDAMFFLLIALQPNFSIWM